MSAPAGAALHLACTGVRRAERDAVAAHAAAPVHPPALRDLNRVSDLLFVMARKLSQLAECAGVPYTHSARAFH